MKILRIILLSLGTVAASSLYISCSREIPQVAPIQTDFATSSTVQVFDATVRSARNYIYVDGAPVSGIALAYGAIFPATAYGFAVNSGTRTFLIKDTLVSTTQVPLTFTENLELGKSYTIFTYDTITSVKKVTVLNNVVVPTDTSSMLRFANFIYNKTAVANVDVYSFRRGTTNPVFTNISTEQVTNFIPYSSGLTDTLYVYPTGTKSPLLVKTLIPSLTPSRSYTATYSGSFTGTKVISTFATY